MIRNEWKLYKYYIPFLPLNPPENHWTFNILVFIIKKLFFIEIYSVRIAFFVSLFVLIVFFLLIGLFTLFGY